MVSPSFGNHDVRDWFTKRAIDNSDFPLRNNDRLEWIKQNRDQTSDEHRDRQTLFLMVLFICG